MSDHELLKRFEDGAISPGDFRHCDHVEAAYGMLKKYAFMEAAMRYTQTIQSLATAAGHPEKFNLTITLAFLGLIAERMADSTYQNYAQFIELNADLLNKDILSAWYSEQELNCAKAREIFVMPAVAESAA